MSLLSIAPITRGAQSAPVLKIHADALRHNLRRFRELAPHSKILLPVKANAYGCGDSVLYPFFQSEGIDILGVANCQEGTQLRALGWVKPILILGGFYADQLDVIVSHEITPSITDLWQVPMLEAVAVAADKSIGIHLKLDLGMGRIGIQQHEITDLLALLGQSRNLRIDGIFTHFPHSGPDAAKYTLAQNEIFKRVAGEILTHLKLQRSAVLLHAANSYSAAFFPETHHDMIRPGILFYGYYQSEADRLEFNARLDFRPCLELVATPISRRLLPQAASISYASLYHTTKENEAVAVLPLGYADGIPRALSNDIAFGQHILRGRVTMDQIIVSNAANAESIRLLGAGVPSLEHWGEKSKSFSYELMTHLGNRLQRVLV